MKHDLPITMVLVGLFIVSQLIGLGFLAQEMQTQTSAEGAVTVEYEEIAIGPRPETTGWGSLAYLAIGIGIGTAVLLILARFKQFMIWKFWFFLAVWMTTLITLDTVTTLWVAAGLALALTAWKIFRPNPIIHNLTEVLVYTGIAVLLVPIFDVFWASVLLAGIAVYDMIAVWKSKHMVTMARFQTDSNLFAGMVVPYGISGKARPAPAFRNEEKREKGTVEVGKRKSAILGGGDIAFPLIFCGTVLQYFILQGYAKWSAYLLALAPVASATAALLGLFLYAKKDRFYPAMPPIVFGCFLGFLVTALVF